MKRKRRKEEANAIGTACRRIDLPSATMQPTLRQDFSSYLDAPLAVYRSLPDVAAAQEHMAYRPLRCRRDLVPGGDRLPRSSFTCDTYSGSLVAKMR